MQINEEELELVQKQIIEEISNDIAYAQLVDESLLMCLEKILQSHLHGRYLSIEQKVAVIEKIFSTIRGYGILDEFMNDLDITEIMINGPNNIFIEKHNEFIRSNLKFEKIETLENTIQKIVSCVGREVNMANPIVDTRLPDGSRVNIVLPPIAINGPVVTIRKFSKQYMTMEKLVTLGAITEGVAHILTILVRAKFNIFISGGTGTGKTTFLNILSNFIPKRERIITIEDTAELQIQKAENLVRLETRNANTAGAGEVTMYDLIRSSLRMRPDRIIVGEIRGKEALGMLQAMNTGHGGALSTGHSNSAQDMISRIETMVLQYASSFSLLAIRKQIASALDIIIHIERLRDKSRRIFEICEVVGVDNSEVTVRPLYVFSELKNSTSNESVKGALVRTKHEFMKKNKLQAMGFPRDLLDL